jgi:hypothetical protein
MRNRINDTFKGGNPMAKDEKMTQIQEAHNPHNTMAAADLAKSHNPENVVQVYAQLVQGSAVQQPSQPAPSQPGDSSTPSTAHTGE